MFCPKHGPEENMNINLSCIMIMNKTISVQSFLIRSKFVFQKIDVKSCFVVNSVYTNNILNLMYKPSCLREVMAFFSTNLELLCSGFKSAFPCTCFYKIQQLTNNIWKFHPTRTHKLYSILLVRFKNNRKFTFSQNIKRDLLKCHVQ